MAGERRWLSATTLSAVYGLYGVYGKPFSAWPRETSSKPSVASTPVLVPIHPYGRRDMRAPTAAFSDGPADGGWRDIGRRFMDAPGATLIQVARGGRRLRRTFTHIKRLRRRAGMMAA